MGAVKAPPGHVREPDAAAQSSAYLWGNYRPGQRAGIERAGPEGPARLHDETRDG